jgi:polysaccharide biosynthesis protein PslF
MQSMNAVTTHPSSLHEGVPAGTGIAGAPPAIAHLGTFPPTQCGLATFGAALVDAIERDTDVPRVGVIDVVEQPRLAAPGVGAEVVHGRPESRIRAARFADAHDALIVQHEFGIFGGPDGEEVLDILDRVHRPVVTVLHTVLGSPTRRQWSIVEDLALRSDALVVMSEAAYDRLLDQHTVDPATVHVIPHGAHPNPPRAGERRAGERPVVLTWGLLGPGKGIETAIDAMAAIRHLIPRPRYIIAGETHPKVLASLGDTYRRSLEERASRNGVDDIVEFDSSYRDLASLHALVRNADVVLLPYDTTDQVTSGVLVEALASERPVVATDFPHARELLEGGAGRIVRQGDPASMARQLSNVLTGHGVAAAMRREAAVIARSLAWSTVANQYIDVVRRVVGVTNVPSTSDSSMWVA